MLTAIGCSLDALQRTPLRVHLPLRVRHGREELPEEVRGEGRDVSQ
ncbi:MAG: hypothetical protein ABSE06_11385 [Anaerolineaceae bacterium]